VTHGKKRETLKGEATLRYFDTLKDLGKFSGIMPNLFTEISTSRAKVRGDFCALLPCSSHPHPTPPESTHPPTLL
jgi:hypothetical protein